jgi:hypothetical protein
MERWLSVGTLALCTAVAWAAPPGSGAALALPAGARLVGTAQVDEVRAFPEMNKRKPESVHTEDVVAVGALDRVYETAQSYQDAIGYFDALVKSGAATQRSRTVTRTATSWELQLLDGKLQNIVVRNTQPTTIETVEGAASVARESIATRPSPSLPPRANRPAGSDLDNR